MYRNSKTQLNHQLKQYTSNNNDSNRNKEVNKQKIFTPIIPIYKIIQFHNIARNIPLSTFPYIVYYSTLYGLFQQIKYKWYHGTKRFPFPSTILFESPPFEFKLC